MSGLPGPQGPPRPPGSNPPYPYPYPCPYPFPIPEHERGHEHEYPHEFHGHEQFMEHEGEHTMYHEYPSHDYPHYPHDSFPRPHHDDYPYDDHPRAYPEFIRYRHFETYTQPSSLTTSIAIPMMTLARLATVILPLTNSSMGRLVVNSKKSISMASMVHAKGFQASVQKG